jgi:hypothetical protein
LTCGSDTLEKLSASERTGALRREKKLSWHTTFGDISVMEPQYRKQTKRIRPFVQSAKVSNRGCSEAKICLAHAEGSKSPSCGGTLQGDVDGQWDAYWAEHSKLVA